MVVTNVCAVGKKCAGALWGVLLLVVLYVNSYHGWNFKRSTVCYLHWGYSRKERDIDQLPLRVMLTQTGKPLKGSEIFLLC